MRREPDNMLGIAAVCLVFASAGLATITNSVAATGSPADDTRSLSPDERRAIFAAAGFRPSIGGSFWIWTDPSDPEFQCDASTVKVVELRDRNGDGRKDALVAANGPCYDDQGPDHILVAATESGWQPVAFDLGRKPRFYPRAGFEWPDIERNDTDAAGCQPFVRWNGTAYVSAGTSLKGQICALNPDPATGN